MSTKIIRFARYVAVGASTFLLDLFLLFLFTDFFGLQYIFSTGIAFIIAVSINYFMTRRFVFQGTLRSAGTGYGIFIVIAGTGLIGVTALMALFVGVFGWHYLISRVLIACIVGFWNYLMNLYVNFKVGGNM